MVIAFSLYLCTSHIEISNAPVYCICFGRLGSYIRFSLSLVILLKVNEQKCSFSIFNKRMRRRSFVFAIKLRKTPGIEKHQKQSSHISPAVLVFTAFSSSPKHSLMLPELNKKKEKYFQFHLKLPFLRMFYHKTPTTSEEFSYHASESQRRFTE